MRPFTRGRGPARIGSNMTDLEGKLDRALNSARATVAFKFAIFMLMQLTYEFEATQLMEALTTSYIVIGAGISYDINGGLAYVRVKACA